MKLTELLTNPRFTRKIFRGVVLVLLIAIAVIFGLFNSQQLFAVFNTLTSVFFPFFLGICIAFVLNAVSFAMALPVLIDVVNGDMSALTGMGGLDAGGTTGGSTGDAGFGSSAWG